MPLLRSVRVIRPTHGRDLDADQIGHVAGKSGKPVVVELGGANYTPSAVVALADLLVCGHPIEIRGCCGESRLELEVRALAAQRWADRQANGGAW